VSADFVPAGDRISM